MTDEQLADIMDKAREYLAEHEDGCGNDNCIGYEARGVIEGLIKECEIAWSSFDALERRASTYRAEVERLRELLRENRAEVERLRVLPQQIADAVSQMQAEDFSIDDDHQDMWVRLDDVNGVIACVAEGRVGDDSLWFTGAEWQAALKNGFDAMTERDDLQTEVERLRADAELGRLVRETMPQRAKLGGRCSLVCYPELDRTVWNVDVWRSDRTHEAMDPIDHLSVLAALRAAVADAEAQA